MELDKFLGCAVGILLVHKLSLKYEDTLDRDKLDMMYYRTVGTLFWPLVFSLVIAKKDRAAPHNQLALPFTWPILMWLGDMYLISHATPSEHTPHKVAMIRVEPGSICSMSFALYGLVGGNMTDEYSHIFMCSILSCIAFGFPTHNCSPGSPEEQKIEAFQRTITTFCTGLMFAGVVLKRAQRE
jgi:hypothetical protein